MLFPLFGLVNVSFFVNICPSGRLIFTCRNWLKNVETHNYALGFHKGYPALGKKVIGLYTYYMEGYNARFQIDACHNENGPCTKTTILRSTMTQIARPYGIV